jgi:hypothetical protein
LSFQHKVETSAAGDGWLDQEQRAATCRIDIRDHAIRLGSTLLKIG